MKTTDKKIIKNRLRDIIKTRMKECKSQMEEYTRILKEAY